MPRPPALLRLALALAASAAVAAPAQAATPSPAALLERFQPTLALAPGEPFAPIRVGEFLADSTLEQRAPDGSFVVVGLPARDGSDLPLSNPAGCTPTAGAPCLRLNQQPCVASGGPASLPCYVAALAPHRGPAAMYARYQALGDRIVLQYWFFYYADLFVLPLPADALWQAQEGDWEVVVVVLDRDGNPLEAAYSEHCTGQRRAFADVPRSSGDHPLVYVALGSHANYFTAGQHAIPTACYPPEVAAVLAQYGLTPMDVTGPGALVGPGGALARVRRIRPHEPRWVGFPGTFGEAQYFHAPAPIGTVALGASPPGPAGHALWVDPLGTVAAWPTG